MKLKNLVIAILVLLFSATMSNTASAQGWRTYKYCKMHSCDDGCYKEHNYYRSYRRGYYDYKDYSGYRAKAEKEYREERTKAEKDYYKEREARYNELESRYTRTYKKYEGDGYTHYYGRHRRFYYDRYYNDNYKPEVDNNK